MYNLVNAVERNRLNPDSFFLPNRSEIEELQVGDRVKLIFEEHGKKSERMWVEITSIEGYKFEGILNNKPFNLTTVKEDEEIIFEFSNIINILLNDS